MASSPSNARWPRPGSIWLAPSALNSSLSPPSVPRAVTAVKRMERPDTRTYPAPSQRRSARAGPFKLVLRGACYKHTRQEAWMGNAMKKGLGLVAACAVLAGCAEAAEPPPNPCTAKTCDVLDED